MERGDTNQHHVWYCRRSYKTPILRELRNERIYRVDMDIPIHNDLHADLGSVPTPDHDVAHELLFIGKAEFDPVQALLRASEYLLEHRDSYNHTIGHHLLKQVGYVIESDKIIERKKDRWDVV